MRSFTYFLAIVATAGVWLADMLLLGIPSFREGWWTLALFALPAAFLVLASGGKERLKMGIAAWILCVLGTGGYVAFRLFTGNIAGAPAVRTGEAAPNFKATDQAGKDVHLSDYTDRGRVVLVFFRGALCPICRAQLRGLASRIDDFRNSKVTVVAVGPQTVEEGRGLNLPFPVLSDPGLEITKKYGLLHEKGMMGSDVPRPTTILIGEDRSMRWIYAPDHIRTRPTVEEILEQLRK